MTRVRYRNAITKYLKMLQFDWLLQRPISAQVVLITSTFKVLLVVTSTSFGDRPRSNNAVMSSSPPPAFALSSLTPMALTAIASLLESVTRRRDDASYTPRGRLVALRTNGARLHVVCDGPHRSASHDPDAISMPCVVLEAGSNSWSAMWDDVAADLGRVTRVLRYDRFGYGHSDDLSPAHMSSSHDDQTGNTAAVSNGSLSASSNVDGNVAPRCPFHWLAGPNHVHSSHYEPGSSMHLSNSHINRDEKNTSFANAFRKNPFEESGTTSSPSRFLHNHKWQGRHPNRYQHQHHHTQCSNSVERSPLDVAKDLCAMLSRVDASPPYIFVAHSLGALYINEAIKELGLGPDAVCGVVYIDPASRRTVS